MGVYFSCLFAECTDVGNVLESVAVKSISFGENEVKTPLWSVSSGSQDLQATILKSPGSRKMILDRSVGFKGKQFEKMISIKDPSLANDNYPPIALVSADRKEMDNQHSRSDDSVGKIQSSPIFVPNNPKHQAATKLQKVYKSFRTRRKLADCAVLVEQSWWELLDFAELKRSSVSFFDIEKHETALSRWSRARIRAAKVGKGLSKNDKAQKLALQHWLEAIDPRHRYGHNLHFYYVKWLQSKCREPFFYWLDIGEGKEANLERCPRPKLQQQCIKYLGLMERKTYEVVVEDGNFIYKQTGELLSTTNDAKWIFVLSTSKMMYVGKKKKGAFQHSSFLAGGVTTAAGRLIVDNGVLKAVWPHSGHYRPTEENFRDFLSFLGENNVDMTDVKTGPPEDGEGSLSGQRSSKHLRSNSSDEDLSQIVNDLDTEVANVEDSTVESSDSVEEATSVAKQQKLQRLRNFSRNLTHLEIPNRDNLFDRIDNEHPTAEPSGSNVPADSPSLARLEFAVEAENMAPKQTLFDEKHDDSKIENITKGAILQRINYKKGAKSYQLGKQLSCSWTTGAGPRISCVRDYPSELQVRALEQVNLSPRSVGHSRSTSALSRGFSTPPATTLAMGWPMFAKGSLLQGSILHSEKQSSPIFKSASMAAVG